MVGELILIVEDSEKNLKLVRDPLQFKGFRTLEAGPAERGIALAGEHRPDLILMDIQLPNLGGDRALARLRSDPDTASIPVVALTAMAMQDSEAVPIGGRGGAIPAGLDPGDREAHG